MVGISQPRRPNGTSSCFPTHPDSFAGLGFLGEAQSAFFLLASPLALIFATHMVVAAMRTSEDLRSYRTPAAAFVVLCAAALMGPALSFVGLLVNARRRAIFEYGRLGQSYVSQFDQKWVRGNSPREPLLGTADIQSLADIANSMKVVREMKIIPFERRHLILFAACIALPVVPPFLMVMPLRRSSRAWRQSSPSRRRPRAGLEAPPAARWPSRYASAPGCPLGVAGIAYH